MKTPIAFALASLVVFGSLGCVDRKAQAQAKETQALINDPTKSVQVRQATVTTISEQVEIAGQIATSDDTLVGVKTAGRIVSVSIKDGDAVSAGQLIAQQDTTTANAQLRSALAGVQTARSSLDQAMANARVGPAKSSAAVAQAQAALDSAKAQLLKANNGPRPQERLQAVAMVRSAQASLDLAKKTLDRTQSMYDQGVWPKQQLDQVQSSYDTAKEQVDNAMAALDLLNKGTRPEDIDVARQAVQEASSALAAAKDQKRLDVLYGQQVQGAQAQLSNAQAQVDIARQAVADCEIRAPYSGSVSGKPVQIGAVVGVGGTVARIIGVQGAYFEGQLAEDDVPKVGFGTQVVVQVTALPSKKFAGHIVAINPQGQEIGRQFSVRVQLDGEVHEIKPGMYADGKVIVRTVRNASVLPIAAILSPDDKPYVFIQDGDKAKRADVTLGLRDGDKVQVVGLPEGAKVVVSGQANLSDGSTLKIQTDGTAAKASAAVGG